MSSDEIALILSQLAAIDERLKHVQRDVARVEEKVERIESSHRDDMIQLRADIAMGESRQNAAIDDVKKKYPSSRNTFNVSRFGLTR